MAHRVLYLQSTILQERTVSSTTTPTSPPHGAAAVSTRDAAAYVGFTEQWMRSMRTDGTGPRYLKVGRAVRYRVKDLDAWMEAHLVGGGRR